MDIHSSFHNWGEYVEPDGRIRAKHEHGDRGSRQNGTLNEEIQAKTTCDKKRKKRKRHGFYCQTNKSKQNDENKAISLVWR